MNHPKFNHPRWNKKGPVTTYDFALVKLADPVDFSVHPNILTSNMPANQHSDMKKVVFCPQADFRDYKMSTK